MTDVSIDIRTVRDDDSRELYALGLETPELKTSASEPFMDEQEFRAAINNRHGVMLLATAGSRIAGFVYANFGESDIERGPGSKWACLVYVVVRPEFRRRGVAQQLSVACISELKRHGMTHVYAWADTEGDGSVIALMKKNGFHAGHRYMWMDRKIG